MPLKWAAIRNRGGATELRAELPCYDCWDRDDQIQESAAGIPARTSMSESSWRDGDRSSHLRVNKTACYGSQVVSRLTYATTNFVNATEPGSVRAITASYTYAVIHVVINCTDKMRANRRGTQRQKLLACRRLPSACLQHKHIVS